MKILIIGLGGIGQRHTRNLRALLGDSVEIIAYRVRCPTHVVTPTMVADQERNVEDVYNIRTFHSLDKALAERTSTSPTSAPTPNSPHVSSNPLCSPYRRLRRLLEKPASRLKLEGTAELVDLTRKYERIAMVGYQLRFHPCFIQLTEILRSRRAW